MWNPRVHGRVCPACGILVRDDTAPLVPILAEPEPEWTGVKPTVGWLARKNEPRRGESFKLYDGMNSIGRGIQDIVVRIVDDPLIPHGKCASIAYDAKDRKFYLIPSDHHRGTIYLDKVAIFEATEMLDLCEIQIGNTLLIFRNLCGEQFGWRSRWDRDPALDMETGMGMDVVAHRSLGENMVASVDKDSLSKEADVAAAVPAASDSEKTADAKPIVDTALDSSMFETELEEITP